jgi:hypothetical protein
MTSPGTAQRGYTERYDLVIWYETKLSLNMRFQQGILAVLLGISTDAILGATNNVVTFAS